MRLWHMSMLLSATIHAGLLLTPVITPDEVMKNMDRGIQVRVTTRPLLPQQRAGSNMTTSAKDPEPMPDVESAPPMSESTLSHPQIIEVSASSPEDNQIGSKPVDLNQSTALSGAVETPLEIPSPYYQRLASQTPGLTSKASSGINDREKLLEDYLNRLREIIEAARRYPEQARRLGLEGKVIVRLVVNPEGAIKGVSLVEPAPFPLLTRSAVQTISSLSRLPRPPPVLGNRVEVTIPLLYRLETQEEKR